MHDYDNYKYYTDGKVIDLTEIQNELLNLLIENKNHLVTFEEIIKRTRFEEYKTFMRPSICVNICRLRKKCNLHISIIYGMGYCLRSE